MNKFYQGVFYPAALKDAYVSAGTWPEHAADVSDEVMSVYSQYPPEGKMLGTDDNGYQTSDVCKAAHHKIPENCRQHRLCQRAV